MARLPTVGGDKNNWGAVLNEYLNVSHNADGTIKSSLLPTSFTRSIRTISESVSAGSASQTDYVYIATGNVVVTLPTAVNNNCRYTVVNSGSDLVSVATTSLQTINGNQIVTLPLQNMSLSFVSNGSNWVIE